VRPRHGWDRPPVRILPRPCGRPGGARRHGSRKQREVRSVPRQDRERDSGCIPGHRHGARRRRWREWEQPHTLSWRAAWAADAEWMSGKSRNRLAPVLTEASSWRSASARCGLQLARAIRWDRSTQEMGDWSCETPVISTASPNPSGKLSANAPLGESKTVAPNPAPPQHGPAAFHDHRRRLLDGQQPPGRQLPLSQRLLATTWNGPPGGKGTQGGPCPRQERTCL
jgi:hypothetical protein